MKAILNKFSPQNIFSLSYGSFFGGTCTISITRVDELTDSCAITGGNGYPEEVEFSIADNEMDNIRETLDMIKHWKNEYECPHDILDGFGWEIKFISDGKKIEKSGYMAYPENYNDVMQELIRFVEELKERYLFDKRYLPLSPFAESGYFVPVGSKIIQGSHYKCDYKPEIKTWSPANQMYQEE